jgi:hypothetical protein
MKWSILILTQPGRERFLARLNAVLKPQVEQYSDVTVHVRNFDFTKDLGTNRQIMVDESQGEYVNFIDDDDLVPANYVSTIYPLLDGVDYIGFRLQMWVDEEKQKPTTHSLKYTEWNGDSTGWFRDISHLNPIRRELAVLEKMSGGSGEDERWSSALRRRGVVKTEHFVPEIMYFYYWRSNKTDVPQGTSERHIPLVTRSPKCPECGNPATGMAGGMRHCNQCSYRWI